MLNYDGLDKNGDQRDHRSTRSVKQKTPHHVVARLRSTYCEKTVNQVSVRVYLRTVRHSHLSLDIFSVLESTSRGQEHQLMNLLSRTHLLYEHKRTPLNMVNRGGMDLIKQSKDALSIYLINIPTLGAQISRQEVESDNEYSQSYRGIYEQTHSDQRNARRRGLGYLRGEWHS